MAEQLQQLKPLNVTCTSTDCEHGLHCFKQKQRRRNDLFTMQGEWMSHLEIVNGSGGNDGISGRCRACGIDLIDWPRVHQRDLQDVLYTFDALKKELIRHYYWHLAIDERAKNHALRKGSLVMDLYIEKRIRTSVGAEQPYLDGRQTPMHQSGNIVYYAQHATASCCRTCIEEWHHIPRGRALTEPEIRYLTELAMLYVKERLPELEPQGKKIPPIRRRQRNNL